MNKGVNRKKKQHLAQTSTTRRYASFNYSLGIIIHNTALWYYFYIKICISTIALIQFESDRNQKTTATGQLSTTSIKLAVSRYNN